MDAVTLQCGQQRSPPADGLPGTNRIFTAIAVVSAFTVT